MLVLNIKFTKIKLHKKTAKVGFSTLAVFVSAALLF